MNYLVFNCILFFNLQFFINRVLQDAVFELISISQEYAIWLMKHASFLAASPDVNEDKAKIIFKSLRKGNILSKDYFFGKLCLIKKSNHLFR